MLTKDIRSRQSTGFTDYSDLADWLRPTSQFSWEISVANFFSGFYSVTETF